MGGGDNYGVIIQYSRKGKVSGVILNRGRNTRRRDKQ
jgi:hypothetical protein